MGEREVTLITATMSKERRLSLKKANRVEVAVIHVVAVEIEGLSADMTGPTVHHVVADIRDFAS